MAPKPLEKFKISKFEKRHQLENSITRLNVLFSFFDILNISTTFGRFTAPLAKLIFYRHNNIGVIYKGCSKSSIVQKIFKILQI